MTESISTPPARGAADASLGELVSRMSEQTSRLVRFAVAGLAALMGKREVGQATPSVPEEAVEGVKQDVHTLESGSRS